MELLFENRHLIFSVAILFLVASLLIIENLNIFLEQPTWRERLKKCGAFYYILGRFILSFYLVVLIFILFPELIDIVHNFITVYLANSDPLTVWLTGSIAPVLFLSALIIVIRFWYRNCNALRTYINAKREKVKKQENKGG
jgi:hypothetical protein